MPRTRRRLIADQNRLLVRIYNEARQLASGRTWDDDVEDAVHDVVADCQAKLRSGRWMKTPKNLPGFVIKLVNDKIADHQRSQRRARVSAREHARTHGPANRDWQPADFSWTEDDIAAFLDQVTERLPDRCRKAYYMVRVEGASYKEAAARLRLSRHTIRNYIVQAQRLFREELERVGFETRTGHAWASPDDSKARPDGNAAVPAPEAAHAADPSCRSTPVAPQSVRDDPRPTEDVPQTKNNAVRPDRAESWPLAATSRRKGHARRTNRHAGRTIHGASHTTHDDARTDDDAPWTQGSARRTDRNSWRTEGAAALRVRETLSQEN